jgi:hypothetical protein
MPTPDAMLFDFSDSEWRFGLDGSVAIANAYPHHRCCCTTGAASTRPTSHRSTPTPAPCRAGSSTLTGTSCWRLANHSPFSPWPADDSHHGVASTLGSQDTLPATGGAAPSRRLPEPAWSHPHRPVGARQLLRRPPRCSSGQPGCGGSLPPISRQTIQRPVPRSANWPPDLSLSPLGGARAGWTRTADLWVTRSTWARRTTHDPRPPAGP